MDNYGIDTTKIIYHPERVSSWLRALTSWDKAKSIYPIYAEVTSSGACNHRCVFCALDYLGYSTGLLNFSAYSGALKDMSAGGVKSIMFAGEGEPLMHPKISDMILLTKEMGIDVAITTNGSFLNTSFLEKTIKYISWIKVSLDASCEKTHCLIHKSKPGDFENILVNLSSAVKIKKEAGSLCRIGVQILLLPENAGEILELGKISKGIGLDYLVIKPYSQHMSSITKAYRDISYKPYLHLADEVSVLNDPVFQVIFRSRAMERWNKQRRTYSKCYAVPFFWSYICGNGDVYCCSAFLGNQDFCIGNINDQSFKEIWEGDKRRQLFEKMDNHDIGECRQNCRMDEVNGYLFRLKNPIEHVNFI